MAGDLAVSPCCSGSCRALSVFRFSLRARSAVLPRFFGPTGGYLFSFPICAMLTGWMVEHGFSGRSFVKGFLAMLAGNILCLIIGGAWLAVMMGFAKGMALGVTAFIAGAFTKSVLGAAVLLGISAGTSRKHN